MSVLENSLPKTADFNICSLRNAVVVENLRKWRFCEGVDSQCVISFGEIEKIIAVAQ